MLGEALISHWPCAVDRNVHNVFALVWVLLCVNARARRSIYELGKWDVERERGECACCSARERRVLRMCGEQGGEGGNIPSGKGKNQFLYVRF